jgi:hypothetical protein
MYMLYAAGENLRSVGKTRANEKQQLKTRNQVELGHERFFKEVLVRGKGDHFTLAIL